MRLNAIDKDLTRLSGLYGGLQSKDLLKSITGWQSVVGATRWQEGLTGISRKPPQAPLTPPIVDHAMLAPALNELSVGMRTADALEPLKATIAAKGHLPQISALTKTRLSPLGYDAEAFRGLTASLAGHPAFAQVGTQLRESIVGSFSGMIGPSLRELPGLRIAERANRVLRLFERMDEVREALDGGDPLAAQLAFVLQHVGFGRALGMMEVLVSEGPKSLIDALEAVLLAEDAVAMFNSAVAAGEIRESVRVDLDHGLEHLSEADYDRAFPALLIGLEGALRDALRARGDRRQRANAQAVADAMKLEHEHALMIAVIYDEANDGRHGGDVDRRAACVLALVGLSIWIEAAYEEPVLEWLGHRLDRHLDEVHDLALAA